MILKDGSHFDSRTYQVNKGVNKGVLISPFMNLAIAYIVRKLILQFGVLFNCYIVKTTYLIITIQYIYINRLC